MIYFNNLTGRNYNKVYDEEANNPPADYDTIIFNLDDRQVENAVNEDWQRVIPGQMAMVVQGDEKLSTTVYKISAIERTKDVTTNTEGFIVRGSVLSKLSVKGNRYNISFMLHGIEHKRLTDGSFQRDVNLISAAEY